MTHLKTVHKSDNLWKELSWRYTSGIFSIELNHLLVGILQVQNYTMTSHIHALNTEIRTKNIIRRPNLCLATLSSPFTGKALFSLSPTTESNVSPTTGSNVSSATINNVSSTIVSNVAGICSLVTIILFYQLLPRVTTLSDSQSVLWKVRNGQMWHEWVPNRETSLLV